MYYVVDTFLSLAVGGLGGYFFLKRQVPQIIEEAQNEVIEALREIASGLTK